MTATNLPATNTPHRFMISLRNYRSLLLLLSVSLIPITGCESVSGWYRHKKASPQKIVRQLPQAPSKNIDRAVIEKGKRTLTVYAGNQVVASSSHRTGSRTSRCKELRRGLQNTRRALQDCGAKPQFTLLSLADVGLPQCPRYCRCQATKMQSRRSYCYPRS